MSGEGQEALFPAKGEEEAGLDRVLGCREILSLGSFLSFFELRFPFHQMNHFKYIFY